MPAHTAKNVSDLHILATSIEAKTSTLMPDWPAKRFVHESSLQGLICHAYMSYGGIQPSWGSTQCPPAL